MHPTVQLIAYKACWAGPGEEEERPAAGTATGAGMVFLARRCLVGYCVVARKPCGSVSRLGTFWNFFILNRGADSGACTLTCPRDARVCTEGFHDFLEVFLGDALCAFRCSSTHVL